MDSPTTTPPTQAGTPGTLIKGSWEERLLQGQQMIAAQKDEAIDLLQQLIDRLSKLPESQRLAANRRLDNILFQAITDLVFYLTYRDRYEQALVNTALAENLSPPEQRRMWQQHSASILFQSGAIEDAFTLLEMIAREGEPEQLHNLVMSALRYGRIDIAQSALDEVERIVNRTVATLDDDEEVRFQRGQLAYLKAHTALAQGNIDECMAWAEHATATSEFFRKNPSYLYVRIVEKGFHREALTLIQRDEGNPLRAYFWGGVAHHRLGRHEEAERHWRQALKTRQSDEGPVELLEYTMAHFYLGDAEGRGLATVLDGLQQERDVSFGQLFLAGLGWAIRGDQTAAHSNFRLALMRSKSMASGRQLPHFWWAFCTDLLPEEVRREYAPYFDTSTTSF